MRLLQMVHHNDVMKRNLICSLRINGRICVPAHCPEYQVLSVFSLMHLPNPKWFLIDLFATCKMNASAHCLFWQLSVYRCRHVWKTYIFISPNATHLLSPFAIGVVGSSESPLRWMQRGGKMQNVTPSICFACKYKFMFGKNAVGCARRNEIDINHSDDRTTPHALS